MKKLFSIFCLLLLMLPVSSGEVGDSARDLIGVWGIYDEDDQPLESIDIKVAVTNGKQARFNFIKINDSELEAVEQQGLLIGTNYVVFNLLELGYSKTLIAKIDFSKAIGTGVIINTQLADCFEVGLNTSLVTKPNRSRLSEGSMQCNALTKYDSELINIKFIKEGGAASEVNIDIKNIDPDILDRLTNKQTRLSGAWQSSAHKTKNKVLIKDIEPHFLNAYSFTYRITDNKTKLLKLNESDFTSGNRIGFLVDNFMIVNTSQFPKNDSLFVTKLTQDNASGRLFQTPNGDCFQLKKPVLGTMICTPTEQASHIANKRTRILSKSSINKIDTNIQVSF